jgi:two-component system sensor histidine kinase CpxA
MGVRLPLRDRENIRSAPVVLIGVASRLYGQLVDPLPWLAAGCGVMALSALFWFPLVRGITRSISQVTRATERVAEGDFEARVPEGRSDELGRLAEGVNRMAARLSGFVNGQKRFLGDVAHELCAPIARLQVALGILEQHADGPQRARLDDLKEELSQMSSLVNELLSFSKAGLRSASARLETISVLELARHAVGREIPDDHRLVIDVPESLAVEADPELLARALGNMLRNAVRYGGEQGGITVKGWKTHEGVALAVRDEGPGVPEAALEKIFEPFYRVDDSRARSTGGTGLGLAIVKTCVEACGGKVHARHAAPKGLEVVMEFPAKS